MRNHRRSAEVEPHATLPESNQTADIKRGRRRAITGSRARSRVAYEASSAKQRLRLLQIARVEPFSEPPVNRSQQFARLLHLALVAPEAREAHGGAEFPGFGLLLAGDGERALEIRFRFRRIRLGRLAARFPRRCD